MDPFLLWGGRRTGSPRSLHTDNAGRRDAFRRNRAKYLIYFMNIRSEKFQRDDFEIPYHFAASPL
jgi:hypothetical protein